MKETIDTSKIYPNGTYTPLCLDNGFIENGSMVESDDKEQNDTTKVDTPTLFKKICTYSLCLMLAFLIGYSFTSYNLIANVSLKEYSKNFLPEKHSLLKHLCPSFLYCGSVLGTLLMLSIKQYSHLTFCRTSAILFLIGYIVPIPYPHILAVFASRFLIGVASGIGSIIVPQIFYFRGKKGFKGFFASFFPFTLLLGITSAVALIPLATVNSFNYLHAIPISLAVLSLLCSLNPFKLTKVVKEKNLFEATKYLFQAGAIKTTVSVILLHVFQKTTGVDFIGNFSTSLFVGQDYEYLKSLSPLLTAAVLTLFTGFIPDLVGRKLPVVGALAFIGIITFSLAYWGTYIWTVLGFILFYNSGLSSIPTYYQNEITPLEFIPSINEMGTFANVLLGLFVALYAAFLFAPSKATIWYTFCGFSLVGAFFIGITIPETKGTLPKQGKFIEKWINPSFKAKN